MGFEESRLGESRRKSGRSRRAARNLRVDRDSPDAGDLQLAIVGVPMHPGAANRPGSRFSMAFSPAAARKGA